MSHKDTFDTAAAHATTWRLSEHLIRRPIKGIDEALVLADNDTSADQDLLYELEGGISVLTLNTPRKLNAWTETMRDRLAEHIIEAERDSRVDGIVLTGSGDKAFCAGQDFAETGRLMNATEAYNAGVLHYLVPAAQVPPTAIAQARQLADQPAGALAATPGFTVAFEAARRHHRDAYQSGEPQQAMAAFLSRQTSVTTA